MSERCRISSTSDGTVQVRMKMSPLEAGKLWQKSLLLASENDALQSRVKKLELALGSVTAQRDELLNALQSIAEYWNQSPSDGAMIDALHHNIETANEAIAKIEAERSAVTVEKAG